MIAQISVWFLAAMLGQGPAEAAPAWLKAVPGDVDVVLRCRGIEATSTDLADMLRAMSPRAAGAAAPALAQMLDGLRGQLGEEAARVPWAALVRAVPPGPDGVVPFAVLVMKDDYPAVLRALASGRDVAPRPQDGGYDEIDGPHGPGSWYAFKGDGFAAVGPDRTLVASVARPEGGRFDATLAGGLAGPFLSGDLGLYVDVDGLAARYADQVAQFRQGVMVGVDQAAEKSPNPKAIAFIKDLYGSFFDSLDDADALTLGLDFGAEGLRVAGRVERKRGEVGATGPADLGKLPSGAGFYVAMNMDAASIQKFQTMSLSMVDPTGGGDAEMKRAMDAFRGLGRLETIGTATFGGGLRGLNVIATPDPKAYLAATEAMLTHMAASKSPVNVYKELKFERDAQEHRGVSYTHVVGTFDEAKVAGLGAGGAPEAAENLKSMMGGGLSYWVGVDGGRVIQATSPTWDQARTQIDQFLDGQGTVADEPGFRAVRSALADRASFMMILNSQDLVRMVSAQLAAAAKKPELKDLAQLPEEPAYFGVSLTPEAPRGYEFRLSLPSAVVPVFEKGMAPILQNLQAQPAR